MRVNIRKHVFRTILSMGIILSGPSLHVQAEQYMDYTYEKDNEYITITGYTGSDSMIEIPSEIEGLSVREIAEDAFWDCDSLVEIMIPDGVVTIGDGAFGYCDNLEKVSIPKSAVNFLGSAFRSSEKLVTAGPIGSGCNIEFGWDETIPIYGFYACMDLEWVTIPEGTKYISPYAFERCDSLTTIELPESVQSIGALAFVNCEALEKVLIPKSVKHINGTAFSGSEKVVVYGYEDSVAEAYAKDWGLQYVSLGEAADDLIDTETPGCYEYSLKAIQATEQYLDYFYGEKKSELGTTLEWGTEEEKEIIRELGLSITKNCKSEKEKIHACYEWVRDNLEFDNSAFVLSAEVLKRGRAGSVGYAVLLRDLLRVNGINAVMVDGFWGDMENFIPVSWLGRENWESHGIKGQAWVEVQYDSEWYLLDALFDVYMCDTEETAKFAYVERVEGLVTAFYEGIPDEVADGIIFKDGKFYLYAYGMRSLGNTSFILNTTSLGMATPYNARSYSWYEDGSMVTGLENGELLSDGWYAKSNIGIEKGNITYYRPYGVTMDGAFVEHNDKLMYLGTNGSPMILTGKLSDYTQLSGSLAITVGQSVDLLSLVPWYADIEGKDVWYGEYSDDTLTFEDGKITGKKPGLAYVEVYVGNQETGGYNYYHRISFSVVDSVEKIKLATSELTLSEKDTYHLSWELEGEYPELGYYLKNKWVEISSSNEAVAKVSCTGRIEALSAGETDIIVRSKDNEEVEAVCRLTVLEKEIFGDVKNTDWFKPYVVFAYEHGLMGGKGEMPDGTLKFDPSNTITRAEFVQMLYAKENYPTVDYTDTFIDVPDEAWYTDAILWAAQEGIVGGKKADYFDVSGMITRQEIALILYKYTLYKEYVVSEVADTDLTGFADAASISSWAESGMKWAVENNVIGGKVVNGQTLLSPGGNAIRAEAATMLKAFMGVYEGVE